MPEGKYLVKSNKVVIEEKNTEISKSGMSRYISLKPYKNTFQTNIPTWIYFKSNRRPNSKFWSWMNKNFGNEPVYYDRAEADNSSIQITRYLDNVGYFHSKVSHTVKYRERKKLARITYHVRPSKPYYVNNIEYNIGDSLMERYIMLDTTKFELHEGDIYNAYLLGNQRDLITERLKNFGYYYFNRNNIQYEVDSNYMNHTLSIKMNVDPNPIAHRQYLIRDISVYPNFSIFKMNEQPSDSAQLTVKVGRRNMTNTLDFYYFGKPRVKPQTFENSIHIYEKMPYNLRSVTRTYESIGNLGLFGNVNIQFDSVPSDTLNLLDCRITMQQKDAHSITVQTEGTRSDDDLGIKGSLSYTNRNIFHGAEVFKLSLKTGFEAQKIIDLTETEGDDNKVFNTREFGITASLLFPKFMSPIKMTTFSRGFPPTTSISLGLNSQVRYYYSRYISTATFSYDWKSSYRVRHTYTPILLNSVKIDDINPNFQAVLDAEANQRKKNQYTNHLILGMRYSLIYNTQRITQQGGSFAYLRADFETSGNLLSLFNNTSLMSEENGVHKIWNVPYAQFFRTSFDIRQHIDLEKNNWLVFRQFVGLGLPYGNSEDLPFERSFYAGGANSLRGWIYRGVGPGAYIPTNNNIEKIGDMQLELNAEYRFPIYNIFNGAVFVDAGNVWTYNTNESIPDGEFRFDEFYKQIAMDAGLGVRIDVSFLLLRLDFAYAMRNPYPDATGSYWRFNDSFFGNWKMNLGIGYPF